MDPYRQATVVSMPPRSNPIGPAGHRVAAAIVELRRERGWTKTDLSRRVSNLGRPMSLDVITEIEKSARALDIDDIIVMARALNVPPILLIFPVGKDAHCQLAPAEPTQETWASVEWFVGGRPYSPVAEAVESDAFEKATTMLRRYQEYSRCIDRWKKAIRQMQVAELVGRVMGEEQGRVAENQAMQETLAAEKAIVETRMSLAQLGYPVPDLPTDKDLAPRRDALLELEGEINR